MTQKTILLFALLTMSICSFADEWVFLGEEKASRREKSDTIIVQTKVFFDKIQIRISEDSVFINECKIYFQNGENFQAEIKKGLSEKESVVIDFPGNKRLVSKIEVFYGGRKQRREKGSIQVFGLSKSSRFDNDKGKNKEWVLLGTRDASFRTEAETIEFSRRDGRFESIRMQVEKNSIYLKSVTVHFPRGNSEEISIESVIGEGKYSKKIDLPSEKRGIDKITFVYRTVRERGYRHKKGQNATVHVWGIKDDDNNHGNNWNHGNNNHGNNDHGNNWNHGNNSNNKSDWELLGESEVSLQAEKDIIRIFGKRRSADKIQIRVQNRGVQFFDVNLYYTDGTKDDLVVRSFINEGQSSQVFDLARRKTLDRIEFFYKSERERGKKAKVEIWGKDK